ncbi:aklavinone 12-hydroxylase [Saccharothrix coeruleofusca]|uniref:aklavinone 12-hydroxylase RdmE n=1 Tax=Saccharothrix coeruleofusca TaxID=33919 RepID=UPI001AE90F17|nr:FAD-dependent oxidoreductase [Saccharothrix coeruleofusca]MBP2338972.1 aklavinone 12-hydroxylase [Saccharothrix coeruleofusca]
MTTDERVQVLVVGAGLGGLSATLFLAQRGVRVLGISKHGGTSTHPRATGQHHRTMELLRTGGVADEVLQGSEGVDGLVIKVAESLRGPVLHTIVHDGEDPASALSPERPGLSGQEHVEPVLLDRARALGADVRFRTELTSFEQDGTGVTARLLDRTTGRSSTVRADYLVAADGAHSPVRQALGIERTGRGRLSSHIGIVFDADLDDVLAHDRFTLFYLRNPAFTGVFVASNTPRRNAMAVEYDPTRESPADYPPSRCAELLRVATGLPDLEPEIVETTTWEMAHWVSTRLRDGRVFLVGDAAKVTPPTGGLGGNTAIGDGFDIAWKLAAVLRGEAGPGLLDSYDAERGPYARLVADGSLNNYVRRMAPHLAGPDIPDPVDPHQLTLGYRCRSRAVLIDDDDPAPMEDPFQPSGRPGFRAPHVPLGDRSPADFFGDWTLITLDPAWRDAPVRVPELADPTGELARRFGIGARGASLLRPDGVVAWRTAEPPDDPAGAIRDVLARLLG